MRASVYVETSIVSYLTSRPSRNLLAAAWQASTAEWWESRRSDFDLFTSSAVREESEQGDPQAARRRLDAVDTIAELPVTPAAVELAERLLAEGALPPAASYDALHVAIAAVHGLTYLLTWNCRHINNAERKPMVREICERNGYTCPEICTPLELGGVDDTR